MSARDRIPRMDPDNQPAARPARRRPPDDMASPQPTPPAPETPTQLVSRPPSSWRFAGAAPPQDSGEAADDQVIVRLPPSRREPTRSLQVDVPADLHRQLKVISLETEMPLKELVVAAVRALVDDYRRNHG